MPRNVRNFWLTACSDGNRPVSTGPRAKDGGMILRLRIRERGSVSDTMLCIDGFVAQLDGKTLELHVYLDGPNGETNLLERTFER